MSSRGRAEAEPAWMWAKAAAALPPSSRSDRRLVPGGSSEPAAPAEIDEQTCDRGEHAADAEDPERPPSP